MQAEVRTGPQVASDGQIGPARGTKTGEIAVSDAHGRYHEAVSRGKVFVAANQSGSAITNLASVATGFILFNPVNSGVNLSLLEITFIQTSTAAASANAGLQLAANVNPSLGAPSSVTALTVRNALLGNQTAGTGIAYSGCTIGAAPVAIRQIWQPSVSATATTAIPPVVRDLVDGLIVIGPGCCVSLSALNTLSGAASMAWEEVPV